MKGETVDLIFTDAEGGLTLGGDMGGDIGGGGGGLERSIVNSCADNQGERSMLPSRQW